MSTTPGSHQASSTSVPTSGDALSASTMRAIINAFVSAYNAHDDDGTTHIQSGTLAQRPAAAAAVDQVYLTTDSPRKLYIWTGAGWVEVDYAAAGSTTPDQKFYLHATRK